MISVEGNTLRVLFDRFDSESYATFLRVKALPEYQLHFDDKSETYTVTAPARFAKLLGVEATASSCSALPMSSFLFDDQASIVDMALDAKRFACWSDCGLGKTVIELEWARQVMSITGGRVLIFTLNEIVGQFIEMAKEFYGDSLPIHRIKSRAEMRKWCLDPGPGLAITNYEKMNPEGKDDDGIVNELRHLAGIALDESSRLKSSAGKQKVALTTSCKGVEYKLSCTATPAPNDVYEFTTQASFLERIRNDGEIFWTYFSRDEKTHRCTIKEHAKQAFFEFMAGWSIYVRDPRKYGWRKNHQDIPEPVTMVHSIPITTPQLNALQRFSEDSSGQLSLFRSRETNAIQRSKLSQVAKGFIYRKGEASRIVDRIESNKPAKIAEIVAAEVKVGLQTLVWTVFDAEIDLLSEALTAAGVPHDVLSGKNTDAERIERLDRFRHGESMVLVSRASMLGYGMNFQCCGSMVFSGWSDSYEQYYQAVRRAYRYGQTKTLRVHIPVIELLEGDMLENIFHKQDQHESSIAEMERNYISSMGRLKLV